MPVCCAQRPLGATTPGTTILQAIRSTVSPSTTVTFSASGSGIDGTYKAAIAVVGETPYAEGAGDRPGGMGLDSSDLATLSTLRAAGVPLVVVLVSGRPLDIAAQLANWDALVEAGLPGTEGQGVADVLFGDYNPTGRLPDTWMQSASQQPINAGDGKPALFALGAGSGFPATQNPYNVKSSGMVSTVLILALADRPPRHRYRPSGPGRMHAAEFAAGPSVPARTARGAGGIGRRPGLEAT